MDTRFKKADLHVHSCFSHDVPELRRLHPRALFETAMGDARMDYFALTDHETLAGYEALIRELPESDRRLVIPGVEHALIDPSIGFSIHTNLFGLNPDQLAEIHRRVRTLADLECYCRSAGIHMQYNHPTWWERDELRQGVVDVARVRKAIEHFDVLELNAGRTRALNAVTENLARAHGKYLTASSDTHTGNVGTAFTEAPGESAAEFLTNIWTGAGKPHTADATHQQLLATVHAVIDYVFDQREQVTVKPRAMPSGNPRMERAARRLLQSRPIMRSRVLREPVRAVLRQLARAAVSYFMVHQWHLERVLRASELRPYVEAVRLSD